MVVRSVTFAVARGDGVTHPPQGFLRSTIPSAPESLISSYQKSAALFIPNKMPERQVQLVGRTKEVGHFQSYLLC